MLLRSLTLLEKPSAGQIFIDGREITEQGANVDEIRQSMGMVFQKFHLFSEMDVMDNLCLAPVKLKGMSRKAAEEKRLAEEEAVRKAEEERKKIEEKTEITDIRHKMRIFV